MVISAWSKVSQTTIVNCFKKAKESEIDQTIAKDDECDPFKEFSDNLKELREKKSDPRKHDSRKILEVLKMQ